jgi:iron complex transport system substrate-binding protein
MMAAKNKEFSMLRHLSLPLLALFSLGLTALASAAPLFPVTVKDAWGTPVTVQAAPRAILSLTLPTDEILFDLVTPDRIRAIEVFAADPGISNIADRVSAVPLRVAGERERVLALSPDLVFVADWKEKDFVQALREAGVTVFVVSTPSDFVGLAAEVKAIGTLVGEPAKADTLLAKVNARLAAVANRVKDVPAGSRPTVLSYSFWASTYAKGTSFDALVTQAGLVNAATKAGLEGWPQLSKEQVIALDPDIIALPSWSYDGKNDPEAFRAAFVADPAFAGLKAVRTGRVLVMPDKHLQATSQYMVDGVEDLARAAWPERFR